MKCPFCGHENMQGADECESCQEDLMALDGLVPKTKIERVLMQDPISKLNPRAALCVSEETSVYEAVQRMNEMKTGCVLVQDREGNLAGIVTERDILFRTQKLMLKLHQVPISLIMTPRLEGLPENTTLAQALHHLSVNRFRHLPVLNKDKPPALLSARDILKYLAKHLAS